MSDYHELMLERVFKSFQKVYNPNLKELDVLRTLEEETQFSEEYVKNSMFHLVNEGFINYDENRGYYLK